MFCVHTFISKLCKIKSSVAFRLQPTIVFHTLKYSGHIAEEVSVLYMKIIPRLIFFPNEIKRHKLGIYYNCSPSITLPSTLATHSLNCSKEFGCLDTTK